MKKRRRPPPRAVAASRPVRPAPPLIAVAAGCFILALALYWGSLRHPLVFDDLLLREDFLRHYADAGFRFDLRWLAHASFGWTYELAGRHWPWHRLVNVVLHAATALLLFSFLARLFELTPGLSSGEGRLPARWIALGGALLFLLHPVAVYGVAYLVQRSILLATLLSLASLRLFLEGLARRSTPWCLAAVAAYFAAVFSKEHAVMLPAVALALAVCVRGPSWRSLRELALPFALFAAIGLFIVLKARGVLGAPYEPAAQELLSQLRPPAGGASAPDAYLLSALNQGLLFFRYLLTWIVPYPGWMSIDVRVAFPSELPGWPHAPAFAAWLAWPVAATALLRRGGLPGLLGLGLLHPWLLSLTEFAALRVQEPYALYRSYLWMSGFVGILPVLLAHVPARRALSVLGVACAALVPVALDRVATFSSAIALWDDAVRKNGDPRAPFVERALQNRGFAYLQSGQYPDALRDFERAIRLNPRDPNAYVGRGTLYARTGSPDRALADFARAIELDPDYPEPYVKRCFTRMLLDRPGDALPDCEKAVALNPRHRDAHTNLGVVYAALNRPAEAEASYRRALDIEPANADANFNYGVLLVVLGRRAEAPRPLGIGCEAGIAESCRLRDAVRGAR